MPWGKWNGNIPKFIECSKSSCKRKVNRDKCLPQEIRKISRQPKFTPKGTRKWTNEDQS